MHPVGSLDQPAIGTSAIVRSPLPPCVCTRGVLLHEQHTRNSQPHSPKGRPREQTGLGAGHRVQEQRVTNQWRAFDGRLSRWIHGVNGCDPGQVHSLLSVWPHHEDGMDVGKGVHVAADLITVQDFRACS